MQRYIVTVEYEVTAEDEEIAVEKVRKQLELDDELGHAAGEERIDYIVRKVA